jgi:hypothetical protein
MHRGKLYHKVPCGVPSGARFHIRIRQGPESPVKLTDATLASKLIEAAKLYHDKGRWYAWLFVLMPDHLHAILSFSGQEAMSRVIGDWKKSQCVRWGVDWQ